MRSLVLLAALSLLVAFAPAAGAAHMGPCTHQYVEIVLYGLKNGGASYIIKGETACATATVGWVCSNDMWTCEQS